MVKADLKPQHIEETHKAYEALGLNLIGFDMIWTEKGTLIVDENTCPGNFPDLYAEDDKNPIQLFADWVLQGL